MNQLVDLLNAPKSQYHRPMEAQTQPQQHPGQHPVGLAQPPQQYPQPWPPYPGYPPPPQSRRWMPYATLAAIIFAGALIAVAIMISGGNKSHQAAPSGAPATSATVPTESTATCKAWRTTSAAFDAIPHLPDGWDWDTPNIDTLISNQKMAVDKALGIFESKIVASDPEQVVSAAHAYIAAKRTELSHLASHTITEADGTAVDASSATLNQLCTQ